MADVTAEERYGLIGLVFGLQNKDLDLISDNLLKLGFLDDTSELPTLVPRLRLALKNATGGTGKAKDMNFGLLQSELAKIKEEGDVRLKTPPFFTVIIRTLTILEGMALQVDPNFRLVKGAYPFVLAQLLTRSGGTEQVRACTAPPSRPAPLTPPLSRSCLVGPSFAPLALAHRHKKRAAPSFILCLFPHTNARRS